MTKLRRWLHALRIALPPWRLARLQAEALVYRFGADGVEIARERERLAQGEGPEAEALAWLVRAMAEDRQRLLKEADTATRYSTLEDWRRRSGAMIG